MFGIRCQQRNKKSLNKLRDVVAKATSERLDFRTGTGQKAFFELFFGLILDPPPATYATFSVHV